MKSALPLPRTLAQAEASSPPRELRRGQRIDRYEILRPIGRGGMGSVWAARHATRSGAETVAIKTVLPDLANDRRARAMFLEEARLASAICHPNVARILDFIAHDDGGLYLVIEWVDGAPLNVIADVLAARDRRIPPRVLLRILADVCAGLHAAHELRDASGVHCDLVHRDVSPHNVLVGVDGAAKLIDFGVAKARHRAAFETTFGVLKGKVHFMAPEQALGDSVDRRADVWSVGAVAYYMLAGHGPFDTGGKVSTLRLLTAGAPLRPLPRDVHPAIERIITGCLASRPGDRFSTAEQLGFAIEAAIEELGAPASAEEVGALVEECARLELSERAPADLPRPLGPRGPSGASLAWTQSTQRFRLQGSVSPRSLTWIGIAGLCLMPAIPFAVVRATGFETGSSTSSARATVPTETTTATPPAPPAPDATTVVTVPAASPPGGKAAPLHARAKGIAAPPARSASRPRGSVPAPQLTPQKRSDDFGTAVETRK